MSLHKLFHKQHKPVHIDTADYDILELNKIVAFTFDKVLDECDKLQKDKEIYIKMLNSIDNEDRDMAIEKIKEIDIILNVVIKGKLNEKCKAKSKQFMEKYQELISDDVFYFGVEEESVDKNYIKRIVLVKDYIKFISPFVDIRVYYKDNIQICLNCDEIMKNTNTYTSLKCHKCGERIVNFDGVINNHKELDIKNKDEYDSKENFIEAFKRVQGKNKHIPNKVIEKIKNELETYNISVKDFRKHQLITFMKKLKLSAYYYDKNQIFYLITDIPPPDFSQYEDAIMKRYNKYKEVYEIVKPDSRSNSLYVFFVMRVLLELEGCKCRDDDFFSLETRDVILEHVYLMKKICRILQDKYPNMNWDVDKQF